jgi:hypothetical protein
MQKNNNEGGEQQDISVVVGNHYLTTKELNSIRLYVANNSAQTLYFKTTGVTESPPYPNWPAYGRPLEPGIYVGFNYGEKRGEIAKDGDNINANLLDAQGWDIRKVSSEKDGVYWKICPSENTNMDAHDGIVVEFNNLCCNGLVGTTPVKITAGYWKSVDGQSQTPANYAMVTDKRTIQLIKIPAPKLSVPQPEKTGFDIDELVQFNWTASDHEDCLITFDGIVVYESYCRVPALEKTYVLSATNKAGFRTTQEYTPQFTFLEDFRVDGGKEGAVHLAWSTKNTSRCDLSDYGRVPTFGECCYPIVSDKMKSVTLTMTHRHSTKTSTKSIELPLPEIVSFTAVGIANAAPIEIKGEFITMDEIAGNPTFSSIVNGYPAHVDDRHVRLSWETKNAIKVAMLGKEYGPSGQTSGYFAWGVQSTVELTAVSAIGLTVKKSITF